MTEILFYHLERRTLDEVLPGLLERTLARGWRALVRPDSAERAQTIDNLLWTWRDDSFLPHAQLGDGEAALQPVLITVEEGNANHAQVLFLAGAPLLLDRDQAEFQRIVVLFDARDDVALAAARRAWVATKAAGHEATYWKQSAGGKWEKQE
ncbi:MAG TPA: DNA polymerase III subunit chi [Rhizomicrobium sp.]